MGAEMNISFAARNRDRDALPAFHLRRERVAIVLSLVLCLCSFFRFVA